MNTSYRLRSFAVQVSKEDRRPAPPRPRDGKPSQRCLPRWGVDRCLVTAPALRTSRGGSLMKDGIQEMDGARTGAGRLAGAGAAALAAELRTHVRGDVRFDEGSR